MRLYDILEQRTIQHAGRLAVPPPTGEQLGLRGAQGAAFKHPSEPGVVYKKADIKNIAWDPYIKFVNLALEHQNNPFFPKIYDAKLYKGNQEEYELVVKMEQLYPITSPKLIDAAIENFVRLGMPRSTVRSIKGAGMSFWEYFAKKEFREKLAAETRNPQLKEALELLEPYIREFVSDLHSGNWMIRLTSAGPQLVIIDPFAPGSDVR